MKRIAICDDNEIQREILAEMLKGYCQKNRQRAEIVEYSCGEVLLADVDDEESDVELIFLDIYMTGLNGIETAKKLREMGCETEIVFLTSTAEYALESYDVRAAGYLVKPVSMKKLSALLNRLCWVELRKRIEVKCGQQYRYPYISDIMYVESFGHKAYIFLKDGRQIETVEKISTLKERIHDDYFLQCHQSYLVNMNYIADIEEDVILSDGKRIPISARRKTETIKTYHQFFTQVLEGEK